MSESWLRMRAIARRQAYLLKRSPHRWFDVLAWPVVDVLLWGSLGVFVVDQDARADRAGAPYLLMGIVLFHVLYQWQIANATGFLAETWSRNVLNLMVTPMREIEYAGGVALYGLLKLGAGMLVATLAAFVFFSFNVLEIGWALIPIAALLMLTGWVISLFVIGLVLRFGSGAEILAWGIIFIVMPLSGVFYPVESLPGALQPIAVVFPTTHIFTAARAVLDGSGVLWGELGVAAAGSVVAAAVGLWFVARMLAVFRSRGYITRFS